MSGFQNKDLAASKKFAELKVLVVEDQPEIRSMIRELLYDMGVKQLFEASDGREALQFIDADFDIVNFIVCDWNMPGMPGIDFLRQIRTVYPSLPFLMVTGRCDKHSVIEARSAGVTAYIRKPFSPGQLEEKMRVLTRN